MFMWGRGGGGGEGVPPVTGMGFRLVSKFITHISEHFGFLCATPK